MTKQELIEVMEDKMGEVNVNRAKKHFHPEIIAFTFDQYYRAYLDAAFARDPYILDGCLDSVYNVPVWKNTQTNYLFSAIPKYTIPFLPVQGGVFGVKKSDDSTIGFEPYSTHFERRNWNRLDPNFGKKIRFWVEEGVDTGNISASWAGASDYESIIWFKTDDASQLDAGDKVDMQLLITFYAHGDTQTVVVPSIGNVTGITGMINDVYRALLSKLGIRADTQQAPGQENEQQE